MKEILGTRSEGAFRAGLVDDGVVECCAELAAERTGDARRAIDLLRVSGEIANERGSRVTVDCVRAALERFERDLMGEMLNGLGLEPIFVLRVIAALSTKWAESSSGDTYKAYKIAKSVVKSP